MIRITYSVKQTALAERIRDDLAAEVYRSQSLLIVLVSAASNADPVVQAEVKQALESGERILPILADGTALPRTLEKHAALDFSRGYSRERLLAAVTTATTSRVELRRANRRALAVIGALAALMFGVAIVTMTGGIVGFPAAEYNEEATFQAQWIDGMIGETLAYVQPRTTEDAHDFAATYEAAPTRLYFYIRGTATAAARNEAA